MSYNFNTRPGKVRMNGQEVTLGGAIIALLGIVALKAWLLMLLLGMFAGYLAIPGLALGYWACVGIGLMWGMIRSNGVKNE